MLQRQAVLLGHDIYIKVQEASMWKFRNTEIWYLNAITIVRLS